MATLMLLAKLLQQLGHLCLAARDRLAAHGGVLQVHEVLAREEVRLVGRAQDEATFEDPHQRRMVGRSGKRSCGDRRGAGRAATTASER